MTGGAQRRTDDEDGEALLSQDFALPDETHKSGRYRGCWHGVGSGGGACVSIVDAGVISIGGL